MQKNDGAARRRFFAICEKPVGVVKMTPSPPGRRLNFCMFVNIFNLLAKIRMEINIFGVGGLGSLKTPLPVKTVCILRTDLSTTQS